MITPDRHLAELNIGRLVAPVGDPKVAPFVDALDAVNALAERSPGFVWRLIGDEAESPGATSLRMPGDETMLVNMTVWESPEALRDFVFKTVHRRFYARRAEWFSLMPEHHFVMWWVAPGHAPTLEEAADRLERLRRDGPSDAAFGWEHLPDAAVWAEKRCA